MKRICALLAWVFLLSGLLLTDVEARPAPESSIGRDEKTGLYLLAGDYRRALESCEQAIQEHPSAESYVRLTYVYQAIDGYLEQLSKDESWMAVEQLYLNLAYRHTEDLVDPPGGLARMAKEMIQTSVRQQSDISAAMAVRLNKSVSDRLWLEQTQWRQARPTSWWQAFPDAWLR